MNRENWTEEDWDRLTDKLSEISERLEASQEDPNYVTLFEKLEAEAQELTEGIPGGTHFLSRYAPTEDGQAPLPVLWKQRDRTHNAPAA